jgi:hypothetical protein
MFRSGSRAVAVVAAASCPFWGGRAWAGQLTPPPVSEDGATVSAPGGLRTFVVEKSPAERALAVGPPVSAVALGSVKPPPASSVLRTTIGLGYVQGADWGAEAIATGTAGGTQVQFDSLFTKGARGLALDH